MAANLNLPLLDISKDIAFHLPSKRINTETDIEIWRQSVAYSDVMKFLLQLNHSMFPQSLQDTVSYPSSTTLSQPIQGLQTIIENLKQFIQEAPLGTGPRRFGNIAFRTWYNLVESQILALLSTNLPSISTLKSSTSSTTTPFEELSIYLLGSFGSSQRLDYGTGHELAFLAFLACLAKLRILPISTSAECRSIVLSVIEPYLDLVRSLILTYTLEPAGSHGVWGLDDHAFLPYIFGSSSLSPPLSSSPAPSSSSSSSSSSNTPPLEGSAIWAPKPDSVADIKIVKEWRAKNMYFSAIGFVLDVKRGPFWEHSPMLYDISGVSAGWAKINKGMIKMWAAEVLYKFPVVQHFPFGGLLKWEKDLEIESIQNMNQNKNTNLNMNTKNRITNQTGSGNGNIVPTSLLTMPSSTVRTKTTMSRTIPPTSTTLTTLNSPIAPTKKSSNDMQSTNKLKSPSTDTGKSIEAEGFGPTVAPWANKNVGNREQTVPSTR